ncbi:MAG TPA: hypothetical protein VK421_07960 [Pyrinomonadaceae bacterium]|nr:hypothetical protein [Pyrinomonadaceae bacterium]
MATRKRPGSLTPPPDRGNFVSEWFGHRTYPVATRAENAYRDQVAERCPFLSEVKKEATECVKSENNKGVCTINGRSNGPRQEWLVCPNRALDPSMISKAAHRLFDVPREENIMLVAATAFDKPAILAKLTNWIRDGNTGIVYLANPLGGEIKLPATTHSPGFLFDSTLVEITHEAGHFYLGRYAIFELQTMDPHGSYRHALEKLKGALRLHERDFPEEVDKHHEWLSERIEGPNISNVFKRTFYQMMFKFQLAKHRSCAGCVFAVPEPVWDSWQKHLGRPDLTDLGGGDSELIQPGRTGPIISRTWIYVFDIDTTSTESPQPIVVKRTIATDAEALSHFALKVAPEYALATGGSADRLLANIHARLVRWWPELELS